jgi:hypothetical protein
MNRTFFREARYAFHAPYGTLALLALLALVACHRSKPSPLDEACVLNAVRANVQAMGARNLAGVMETIHPDSPNYAATQQVMEELLANYTLRCKLENAKVVSVEQDEAQVSFVQTTEKVSGEMPFDDNRVEGIHLLKKHDGVWKIYSSHVTKSEFLKKTNL